MSSKHEPWSLITGQRIPYFDRCELTITQMFNMREIRCKARPHNLVLAGVWEAILRDIVIGHGHKRPRSPPLVTLTIRKGLCLFLLYACMRSCYCSYGDSLGDPRFQCEAYRVNYGNLQWSSCALRLYGLLRSTKTSCKLLTYDRIKLCEKTLFSGSS